MSQVVSLVRRGFHEVPHLMFGGGFFLFSTAFLIVHARRYYKYDRHKRQWKRRFVVVREEDFDPKQQVHPIDKKYPIF